MSKTKATKGTIVFRIIYAVLTLSLIAVIAYGLGVLWHFLEAFEKSQPEIPAKAFIDEIHKNKTLYFDKLEFTPNDFEEKSYAEEYFNELANSINSFTRNGKESNDEQTVYTLKNDKDNIANITVKSVGKDLGYGFRECEVTDIKFGQVATSAYSVTIPDNAVLYCNGKEVDRSFITETGEVYKETEHFYDLGSGYLFDDVYTIDGFVKEPTFTAKNAAGDPLELKDGRFLPTTEKNEELSQLALDCAISYSKFIVGDEVLWTVSNYLAPNMPLYNDLVNFMNYWTYHSSYEFQDETAYDPFFYSDNAASVRVTYKHIMYGVPASVSVDSQLESPTDYTVYLVNIDGEWKVTDITVN
ncbi:MAG: hypothetical protein HDT44_09180 [Ruminococcaceae bacterium]|nr:hypothetical protein [Oscillospiraceae bacterium]